MKCCQCDGIEREFDPRFARRELKRYRRKGLRRTTRILVDALRGEALENMTLLDIGGGIGGIQLALLKSRSRHATSVEASSAFLQSACEEAVRQGFDDRIDYVYGDFVQVAARIDEADIVTLDRVICCYDDMPRLVSSSAKRAASLYGLVYPRDTWWTKSGSAAANLWFRLRRSPMRTFVHPTKDVDSLIRQQGFRMHTHRTTSVWQVDVYRR